MVSNNYTPQDNKKMKIPSKHHTVPEK
jgi:hypothetical protein